MVTLLAQTDAFWGFPAAVLERLVRRARRRWFPPGAALVRQGEVSGELHVIVRGRVVEERVHPDLTEPLRLGERLPSEVVPFLEALDAVPSRVTYRAVEETETLALGRTVVLEALLACPALIGEALAHLSARLRSSDDVARALRAASHAGDG